MFKYAFVLLSALLAFASASDVLVVTDASFEDTIKNNPFVLVEFYAPWCGHCKKLEPEYDAAAAALKDYEPKVVLAKLDATVETVSAGKFGVKGFPTLKWFVNGKETEYTGGRTESTLVSWIKKKTGPAADILKTEEDLAKFQKEADAVAVGFFKDEAEAASFLAHAQTDDDTPYGVCYGDCAALKTKAGLKAETQLAVLQNFDEGKAEFTGDLTSTDEISVFVASNSLPTIIAFSQATAPKIFSGSIKNQLLIFVDGHDSETAKPIKDALTPVAKNFKEKMMFVTVQKTDAKIIEFFGVTEADMPTVRIINMEEGAKKYKFDGAEISAKSVEKFVEDFFAGNAKMDLKSAAVVPESEQGPVRVVVGTDFDEVVSQEGKDVLVEFYAPWCGHCKKLEPIYLEVAEHFKDKDTVVLAKMDATENEVASVQVSGFPTLKFFPAGSSEAVDYDGPREKEGIIEWLNKNAKSLQ